MVTTLPSWRKFLSGTLSKNDTQSFFSAECHYDKFYKLYLVFNSYYHIVSQIFFYVILIIHLIAIAINMYKGNKFKNIPVTNTALYIFSWLPNIRKPYCSFFR